MAGPQLKSMDVSALLALRGKIDAILDGKRKELERALAELGHGINVVGNGKQGPIVVGDGKQFSAKVGKAFKRARAPAKYQSKKDKSLKWSGRGLSPRWMREEMKGTKLKKEDF